MAKETSLRELIREAVGIRTCSVVVGTVTSVNPIEIKVANDAKLILTDSNVYVPKHLTNYTVSIKISGENHECQVKNALKNGDEVYLLSYEEGSQYFVLDKVG